MATLSPNFQIAPPGSPAARPRSEAAIVQMPATAGASDAVPIRSQRVRLPPGDGATTKTIRAMEQLAMGAEGARSPRIRQLALHILHGIPGRQYAAEIAALYHWVKQNIAFRGEFAETLQSPEVTARLGAGDCDCQVMLLAALLGSVGFRTRFVTVAGDPTEPDEFSHVYLEVRDKRTGQWTPLDTTDAKATPGWAPAKVTRRKEWAGMGDTAPTPVSLVSEFGMPLVDAAAQRLAYGQAPFAPGLSPTPLGGDTSPITQGAYGPFLLAAGLFGLLWIAGRRR